MKDFIIVGHGLAAHVLMHTFSKHNITFTTIGTETLSACSRVAAGIYNPIVFKRSTKSWLARELISDLEIFYHDCELRFGKKVLTKRSIIKPFTEDHEKVLWLKKSGSDLKEFIDEKIYDSKAGALAHCSIPNGYGIVTQSGNLNVSDFIDYSAQYFSPHFIAEVFDYSQLHVSPDQITYGAIAAKHIIFCEGYRVKDNPFFNWIPLKPAKGEILTIAATDLNFKDLIFNKNAFLMDLGHGLFTAGATYAWDDITDTPTASGLTELNNKMASMIDCNYKIIKHKAGVRPSSLDRRPIIGKHPAHKNLFVFNGLGTKGVMLAPYFAKNFVNFYQQNEALHPEVNIERFYRFYEK